MRRLIAVLLMASGACLGQTNAVGPQLAAYTLSGSSWIPQTSTLDSFAIDNAPAVELYCLNTATQKWVPWTSECGGGGASGLDTAGLVAYYKMDEGTGTTLTDSSGNGNTANFCTTTAAPAWGSVGITFNSTNLQCINLPAALGATGAVKTWVIVAQQTPLLGMPIRKGCISELLGASGATGLSLGLFGKYISCTAPVPAMGTAAASALTTSGTFASGTNAYGFVLDATSDHIYVNGVEQPYSTHGGTGSPVTGGNLTLGKATQFGSGAAAFDGTMYTVLGYSTEKTSAQMQAIYTALLPTLQARGVAFSPLHPNLLGNQYVAVGDSLTAGLNSSNPATKAFPAVAIPLLSDTFTLSNLGISGWQNSGVPANCLSFYQPFVSAYAPKNLISYWMGTNSFTDTANWMAGAACLKATGAKVIAISLKSVTGSDAGMQAATAFYRANWQTVADGFVDIQDDPLLGATGASANLTLFSSDGTHLTDAGYLRVAQFFANAANKLYGSSSTDYNTTTAATYQMLPADGFLFADNTSNAQVITLPDCIAYSGSFTVKAGSNAANAITIKNAIAAETVDGVNLIATPMTLAAKSLTEFLVVPGPLTTGGCTWRIN